MKEIFYIMDRESAWFFGKVNESIIHASYCQQKRLGGVSVTRVNIFVRWQMIAEGVAIPISNAFMSSVLSESQMQMGSGQLGIVAVSMVLAGISIYRHPIRAVIGSKLQLATLITLLSFIFQLYTPNLPQHQQQSQMLLAVMDNIYSIKDDDRSTCLEMPSDRYCMRIIIIMRNQVQKSAVLKDDEKYLEGINLITGDKIDYGKHLLTETEVNAMCVSEKLSKLDKFLHILAHGEKIQRWSIFQNMSRYVESSASAERILAELEKNYHQFEEFITIIGEGFLGYIKKAASDKNLINERCFDSLYRLLHRTITAVKYHGSDGLGDWMLSLTALFELPDSDKSTSRKTKLNQLKEFINGSFSMNTLPQRRKTALELIDALLDLSQQIEKQAYNKIIFFNSDLNPSTRVVICSIMRKILRKNAKNPQIWKCVQEYYYTDKSRNVKEKAFQILTQIYHSSNAEMIFREFENQEGESVEIVAKCSTEVFLKFEEQLKKQSMYQLKVFSFLNRLLRKNPQSNMGRVIEAYKILMRSIPESVLVEALQLKKFDLQCIGIVYQLILFHEWISHLQFKEEIKRQILKGIRYHQFQLKCDANTIRNLLDILQLNCEEDISNFTLLLGKQVDACKWRNIELFLDRIAQIKLYQTQFERIMTSIMKIYHNCPYFLLEKVHAVILYLMLNDRKNMEIYQKIKDKYVSSRCWSHRRNYIKLYAFLKMNASFEFNKQFPCLVYKNILSQKSSLIKLQFVREFQQAYRYIDPTAQQEKSAIKQTIARMAEDKDRELASAAQSTLESLKEVDRDYQVIHSLLLRNKDLYESELQVNQVQAETKKHIKTEKIISKDMKDVKPLKKSNNLDNKTSLNLIKLGNVKPTLVDQKLTLKRSNSSQNKKEGVKFNLPTYKKSRF